MGRGSWFSLVLLLVYSVACAHGRDLLQQCPTDMSFEALKPSITRAPVAGLEWVGKDDMHVFAITRRAGFEAGGLWRSADGGSSWSELTVKLNETIKSTPEPFSILAVYSLPTAASNVVILGTGTFYWLSQDYGETVTPYKLPNKLRGGGIKSMRRHPSHPDWLLMLIKRPDCKAADKAQVECPHDLWVTTELFTMESDPNKKWKNLTESANKHGKKAAGFVDFDWMANLCARGNCETGVQLPDKGIFATMYENPGDYNEAWDPDVHFVASGDFFERFDTHVRCGNMFELLAGSVYLAFSNSCPTDINGRKLKGKNVFPKGITLYTSRDGGSSFVQACLPVALKQEGYELMETADGKGAIVIVDYVQDTGYMDVQSSSVYVAGPHHALFSLSLTEVAHAQYGVSTDFARIEGIPGVYIANQLVSRMGYGGGGSSGSGDSDDEYDDYFDISDLSGMPLMETRISFNGGGHWQRIPAPKVIRNPACDRCDGQAECYLHLHGMSSWDNIAAAMPAVYSNPSAPGLVMATGNVAPVGQGLDDTDGLCTWLSTDGGVNWVEVADGTMIYEFADWGGVIVMARHPGKTNTPAAEVRFSIDYGRCWQTVPLETALLVDNIRIEPDGQRPRVIVHGRACRKPAHEKCGHEKDAKDSASEGLMYVVDVAQLMSTKLTECASSEYSVWTVPTPSGTPRSVLGQTMQYTRRNQDAVCLNGGNYVRPPPVNTTKDCTVEDVECDYAYIKDANNVCQPLPKERLPKCPVLDDGLYSVSKSGLRLLHGDVCNNISAIISDTDGKGTATRKRRHKNEPTHHSAWFGFLMFLLAVAVLGGVFFGWWRFMASDDQRDTITDIVGTAGATVASLWGWLVDKIRGLIGRRSASSPGQQADELGYFQPLGDPGGATHDVEGRGGIFTLK